MIPLTERLLNDAAGWQVMKMAKALQETRRVISANYTPPILKGLVREGNTEFRAGLKVITASNVENLCSCRPSRDFGQICAHSIAVGLATLKPAAEIVQKAPEPVPIVKTIPFAAGSFTQPRWIELHLVLGPNFKAGLEKNELTIGVEASRGTQRILVKALSFSEPWICSTQDLGILNELYKITGGEHPGMLICTKAAFGKILTACRGFDRMTVARREKMSIHPDAIQAQLVVEDLSNGGIQVQAPLGNVEYFLNGEASQWKFDKLTWQQVLPVLPTAYQTIFREAVTVPQSAATSFREKELPTLLRLFHPEDTSSDADEAETATPHVAIALEGSLNQLQITLQFIYGKQVLNFGSASATETKTVLINGIKKSRNVQAEEVIIGRLKKDGFATSGFDGALSLKGEHAVLSFLSAGLPALRQAAGIDLGPRLTNILARTSVIRPQMEITRSGEDWFELSVQMTGQGNTSYSPAEIQRLINTGKTYDKKPNGSVVLFETSALCELQEILRDCGPDQNQSGKYRIGKMHAGFINAALGSQLGGKEVALKTVESSIPDQLESVLRPYQAEGVRWMHFLAGNHLGGILADEMGLGKTLQALAFFESSGGKALVVCPSSLVFNWEREAKKFTPKLRTLVIEGSQREPFFQQMNQADLVITSYALLRRDIAYYQQTEFRNVVLDEANHIKNPDTQNALAAQKIRATNRFALTGTPVENSVRDVWSLANFVLPGYLGRRDDFKDRYELPIQRGGAPEVQKRLANRLRPIMLRRLKKDVAKDLPERLEQVAWVELTDSQKGVYRELLDQGRRKIEEASQQKNAGKSQMAALTALLRLRQACCDLRLLGLENPDDPSAKLEMLEELLGEAMDGGHRVLVFSQFVSMLKLISDRMKALEIPFAYLDGSTRDRAGEVDKFQNSADLPLFLISLKAGGVGLNLSAADTVIHFDPWWNPAVEAQATDRAHRIGQTRVVTSYKLIAKNTVEEKILSLQQRKRDIIDATVESEEPAFGALTLAEISDLMS